MTHRPCLANSTVRLALASAIVLASLAVAVPAAAQTDYPLGPDSERHAGVPAGTVTKHTWTSRIFPGTQRDYWVYVPAQYEASVPAAVMVFQDGGRFVAEDGRWRLPIVFDNLVSRNEMPVTIGIVVDPGILPARSDNEEARYDRSFEYDALGDRYARFLTEELLPEVGKTYALSADPNLRAIGGSSSGGICAFTVAWNRPDAFRRVLSFIGSYTGLRGGDTYPTLVRKSEPRPLRVFLEDGSRDLDIYSGSWWIGNQGMASALEYAGYDVKFVTGDRGHDSIHGSSVLADALRWLWRDWTQPIAASRGRTGAERHYATEILDPSSPGWEKAASAQGPIAGLAVGPDGDVYFSDARAIRRLAAATAATTVFRPVPDAGALAFGAGGRLLAVLHGRRRVAAYAEGGADGEAVRGIEARDLLAGASGALWLVDAEQPRIWHVETGGARRVAWEGPDAPAAWTLSPDQSLLDLAPMTGRSAWSYQLAADGALGNGQPFYRLETTDGPGPRPGGMTVDSEGYLYVATALGVQVFDQPGRLTAILAGPPGPVTKLAFGGAHLDTLYAAAGDTLYRRTLRRTGVPAGKPVKPPVPRL